LLDLFKKVFARESSKQVAKERLRLVLLHDRSSLSPQLMDTLRNELIQVISKYVDIDENGLDVSLDSSGSTVALVASIPVKGMRRTGAAL